MRPPQRLAVRSQQGMSDHLLPGVLVPEQLLNAEAASIPPPRGRHHLGPDNFPPCRVGLVIPDQLRERAGHGTRSLSSYRAAATTFLAASVMPAAVVTFSPLSARILRPCSTLVPSSRTT